MSKGQQPNNKHPQTMEKKYVLITKGENMSGSLVGLICELTFIDVTQFRVKPIGAKHELIIYKEDAVPITLHYGKTLCDGNVYAVINSDLKERDGWFTPHNGLAGVVPKNMAFLMSNGNHKKVLATNDPELIADGVMQIKGTVPTPDENPLLTEAKENDNYAVTAYKAGRCFNGAHRDSGTVVHLVKPLNKECNVMFEKSLCGVRPGDRSYGWNNTDKKATCEKCLKKWASIISKPEAGKEEDSTDLMALSDKITENHNLPKLFVNEPVFQTINGALNYFVAQAVLYRGSPMSLEQVQSLLLKTLVYYRYSPKVKELYRDFGINDYSPTAASPVQKEESKWDKMNKEFDAALDNSDKWFGDKKAKEETDVVEGKLYTEQQMLDAMTFAGPKYLMTSSLLKHNLENKYKEYLASLNKQPKPTQPADKE